MANNLNLAFNDRDNINPTRYWSNESSQDMARDTTDEALISGTEELVSYLEAGCKPREQWCIGTEHEKFPFYTSDNSPVPYEGPKGIRAILQAMQAKLDWEPIINEGNIIGLVEPRGKGAISLEPGGQFELSGAPLSTVHQTCREVNTHLIQLREITDDFGIRFLGMGGSPKWALAETPIMPKSRYAIMTDYMSKVGHDGLNMMYRTCTIQVNLDFSSETDMRRKMQVAMKLQPVATALFASSPFTENKPNGYLSWRSNIWRDTDHHRAGILPFVFPENFGFADYVEWALNVPMYFVLREGHYYDATHVTFRQFMSGALRDKIPEILPNIGDWANHLSTLFPEVRLKRFLEMRGADGGPWRRICALPAYWVGLLYDPQALDAAEQLTHDWQYEEVCDLRDIVPVQALNATFRNRSLYDIARETIEISHLGLKNRKCFNNEGFDETHYLAPLEEIVARRNTDAEEMLNKFHTIWGRSVEPVFFEYAY